MERLLKTEAVVLRARNYNEADQILTLFTEKVGKISAIVKGVKKPKSKLRGGVQVFSHTNLALYLGQNLATVTGAETINTFAVLREDLVTMGYAAYLAELLDAFTPLGEREEDLFRLALMGNYLLSMQNPWLVARVYEIRLLTQLGYQPHLENCVACGRDLEANAPLTFAGELGGIICPKCISQQSFGSGYTLRGETLGLLKRMATIELSKIDRLRISQLATQELENVLELHITVNLGKKLNTKNFLHSLA